MTALRHCPAIEALRKLWLTTVMLSFTALAQGQAPPAILDWHELLTDPDPVEIVALAQQYERAIGYRRDYGRARQLYCAAARLGYMPAQRRLAWMYANGLGAPRDTDLAAAWLTVAAENGDLKARRFLAFVGEPAVNRKPRCTYESRFDDYAVASIFGIGLDGALKMSPEREQITTWVRQLAPDYGLDPNLILAIIKTESNFNPQALSPKNAAGLMQLIPSTAARFGVTDRTNPIQNLHGGMAYIRWLLSFFQDDLRLSLAGYNAGERAVEKYLGVPPYPETIDYIEKVIRAYGKDKHPPIKPVVEPSRAMSSKQR